MRKEITKLKLKKDKSTSIAEDVKTLLSIDRAAGKRISTDREENHPPKGSDQHL